MQLSERIKPLSKNVFADMDLAKQEAISQGKTIIDLSLGSSDLPTPPHIIKTIEKSLLIPKIMVIYYTEKLPNLEKLSLIGIVKDLV